MKITLLEETTKNPLSKIGYAAGVCWNGNVEDKEQNVKRAKGCIKSGHGRVLEYVDIEFVLEDASARMIRELYTHIGGDPTRLQSSTRYVDAQSFKYFTPPKIASNEDALKVYQEVMSQVAYAYSTLTQVCGITKEDAANVLPLGMHSKMVMKCNLRMLINLMNQRLCTRAYHEFRVFANLLKAELSQISDEWEWITTNLFVPKCEVTGFCTEDKCCGRKPVKPEFEKAMMDHNLIVTFK